MDQFIIAFIITNFSCSVQGGSLDYVKFYFISVELIIPILLVILPQRRLIPW